MTRRPLRHAGALLADESGAALERWLYPALLLLILFAIGFDRVAEDWDRALFDFLADLLRPVLGWLG